MFTLRTLTRTAPRGVAHFSVTSWGAAAATAANMKQNGKIMAEYVWIGGGETVLGGFDLRSKTRTLDSAPKSVADLPQWNYDGSSTNQAPGEDSEVLLNPVAYFSDPFRGGDNLLVMCEAAHPKDNSPLETNTRRKAKELFDKKPELTPLYGIEQEYTLFNMDKKTPLGWPEGGYPGPQGPYYCGVGAENAFGRHVADLHYKACLHAGIKIAGQNAEVMAGQWEFQIGPCTGIDQGDHLWMARYLMVRVAEELGVVVSFDPKPIPGDWNGAGAHVNYCNAGFRNEGSYPTIIEAIKKLESKHAEHIAAYGEGNARRLTGLHETAPIDKFSYGVADRGASIRIPRKTEAKGKGYIEDRRPASNCDPYVVTAKIFETTCL